MSHPIADKLPIGVTMGEAAGIGPEIIAKAHSEHADVMRGSFVVGDVDTMRRASRLVALNGRPALPVAVITDPAQVIDVPPHWIAVLQVGAAVLPVPWSQFSANAGGFAAQALPLPNALSLLGVALFAQTVALSNNPPGFTLSEGLRLTIGG